jgi:hypothetical protein
MDLSTTPDIYSPVVDNNGNYVDFVVPFKNGLFCPCGSRQNKLYENSSKFHAHIKTKCHQKWLEQLNHNKANFYVENIKNKELIENQKKIIQNLENQLHVKSLTIDYLTQQLANHQTKQPVGNLLDMDD